MGLLEIEELVVEYAVSDGSITAVDNISTSLDQGVIRGILGESGCGKSTFAESIVRILPDNASIPSGKIVFDGQNLAELSEQEVRALRWEEIAFIPQNAMACLDPVKTIKRQMIDVIQNHRSLSKGECVGMAEDVFDTVGIETSRLDSYPHELSGGMKQRVILAMSLLLQPKLIIADEPTTGVDVITRDRILNDIERYRDEFDISVIIISHDIADMIETCDELSVMYGGKVVESGPTTDIFAHPRHPYTIGLKNSLPSLQTDPSELIEMAMNPPNMRDPPDECRFFDRCPYAEQRCLDGHPPFEQYDGVEVACYRADEAAELRSRATDISWFDVGRKHV